MKQITHPESNRLHNIIWHKFDVPWYWIQVKLEIKKSRTYIYQAQEQIVLDTHKHE